MITAILTLTLFSVIVTIIYSIVNGITPNLSSRKATRAMISLIEREGTVVDCGSGWGTVLFSLSKMEPERSLMGIENSPIPLLTARIINLITKSGIRFIRGNIYKIDLSEAAVILCYLYPGGMKRFSSEIIPKLKPGTVIISNYFALPGLAPEKSVILEDIYHSHIYRYCIK